MYVGTEYALDTKNSKINMFPDFRKLSAYGRKHMRINKLHVVIRTQNSLYNKQNLLTHVTERCRDRTGFRHGLTRAPSVVWYKVRNN